MIRLARTTERGRRLGVAAVAAAAALGLAGTGQAAAAHPGAGGSGGGAAPPDSTTSAGRPVDLGALFIGAHPDDEAGLLSAFGEWGEENGLRTGVVTVTRGEGGGNAVGPEEGPALGLLREKEERAAVAKAGITDVFNLDKVDFYYTVSNPLTQQVWDHEDTLARVVRIIRQTRPEVLTTMNPAPSPGNHGNHQEAGRLAVEAYAAAGDPDRFPEQITKEGLRPWSPAKVLMRASAASAPTGPSCSSDFTRRDPTANLFGVWAGDRAESGQTWAALEREAQRVYASQGWAGFPDVPSDPNAIGCDFLQQIDARVPFAAPGSQEAAEASAPLAGATTRPAGTVPLGTALRVSTSQFGVLGGEPFTAVVEATAPKKESLSDARLAVAVPSGWSVAGSGAVGDLGKGETVRRTFTVTPPAGATVGDRVRVAASLAAEQGSGYADRAVEVVAPVAATQQLLPQVADFRPGRPR